EEQRKVGARRGAKTGRRGTAEAGGGAGEHREPGGPAAQSRGRGACQGCTLLGRAGELGVADRREDHARVAATADGAAGDTMRVECDPGAGRGSDAGEYWRMQRRPGGA